MTPAVPRVILLGEADSRCTASDARALGGNETGLACTFFADGAACPRRPPRRVAVGRSERRGTRGRAVASPEAVFLPLVVLELSGCNAGDGAARPAGARAPGGVRRRALRPRRPGVSGLVSRALGSNDRVPQKRGGKTGTAAAAPLHRNPVTPPVARA